MPTDEPAGPAGAAEPAPPAPPTPPIPVAFVDASALVALVDRADPAHAVAVAAYRELVADGYKLFTTDLGLAEAHDLIRLGLGPVVAARWLAACRLAVYHVTEADLADARRRLAPVAEADGEPGRDVDLSLTDALSLVVMDRFAVSAAFAVDPRFLARIS